jgi:hypothetical protein
VATTARNLCNLGLLYERQGDTAKALPLIAEAALIAERIGMPQAVKYRAKAEELRTMSDER